MRALASTENVTTIDFMLNTMAADKTLVLEQDFFTFISYISGATSIGNKMAFDWARVHWAELVDRFSTGKQVFDSWDNNQKVIETLEEWYPA